MSRGAWRRACVALPFAPLLVCIANAPGSAQDAPLRPYHELVAEPTVVALTPDVEGTRFALLLGRLEAAGVRIPVSIVGTGLVVIDAPGADAALRAEPGIAAILRDPEPNLGRSADPRTRGLLLWWNAGFETPTLAPSDPVARESVAMCAGARSLADVLAERGIGLRCGPSGLGRTHFVQGKSIVNLVYPESPAEAWTEADLASTLAELVRACRWWSLKSGSSAFVIVDRGPVPTAFETAAPRLEDELHYIEDCMAGLGFPAPCGYEGIDQLNEASKTRYGGHWAWTQFILNAEGFLGTSAIAYAYLGGPHTVATRGNGSLPDGELDRVIAHEMGHIYQALDEYAGGCGGCGGAAGYLNVPNDNCESCYRNEGRCVMRGGGAYTAEEAAQMEIYIDPCRFTKGMAGLWDVDRDGIADVLGTYPETTIETALPDTVEGSLNVAVTGRCWDVPYPAPPRYVNPQTINTIRTVEYSIDNSAWRPAAPIDGYFLSREETWVLRLPELGGGSHRVRVRGVNTVAFFDRTPAEIQFFVHDVKLREELEAETAGGGFELTWQVEGEDFGGAYRLHRREDRGEESVVATIASRGGRHDRHRVLDEAVRAGHSYQYRLDVAIEGRGVKSLSTAEAVSVLPPPPPGEIVAAAPNPSSGEFLFTVSVPRGPRPDAPDVQIPGETGDDRGHPPAPALRGPGDPEDPRSPFTALYRDVRVAVFDVRGRLARDLGTFRARETERFNVTWDGRDPAGRRLPSGVYFLRADLGFRTDVKKITLRR